MPKLFLTSSDQIVDLERVSAIEILERDAVCWDVAFHLVGGQTVLSPHNDHEAAIQEKWEAFEHLSVGAGPAVNRLLEESEDQ